MGRFFFEGSYALCDDWKEGSMVHFLIPDQSGIYSKIEKHVPNSMIQFSHIGNVVNGKEQAIDDETKKWSGATEIYRLMQAEDTTTLEVALDVMDEHLEFMEHRLPIALGKIKDICTEI